MKLAASFFAVSEFLHGILFYTIFFVKICCCKFSYFFLIFYLDDFRLVSTFLTFSVKFYQIRKWYLWVICHHFFSPGIKLLFIPHPVHSLAILQERQCTLKGQARYVNVRGSVHCKGVYRVGDK